MGNHWDSGYNWNCDALSSNRKAIKWRIILSGLAVQLLFAFIVLKWEAGREALLWLSEGVQN